MNLDRKLALLQEQIDAARTTDNENERVLAWRDKTKVVGRLILGEDHPVFQEMLTVSFRPQIYTSGMDFAPYRAAGVRRTVALLEAAKVELSLQGENSEPVAAVKIDEETIKTTFIIHGHDGERKHELARFLKRLTGAEPMILHELPSRGSGLLDKLETYAAGAAFAVALLTADDTGSAKGGAPLPRARQNVIFEAGYFTGLLGRANVALLYETGVELPSDLQGVVYIELDASGAWKATLAREVRASGLLVDATALLSS